MMADTNGTEPQKTAVTANVDGCNAGTMESPPSKYWEQLVRLAGNGRDEPVLGEFSGLQRLNLTHLFNELARIKADIRQNHTTSLEQMNLLRQVLHQYADAIRDYKYITELNHQPESFALNDRILIERAFRDLANPSPQNYPYDTKYLTLRGQTAQQKDSIREFLRKSLHRRFSWSADEKDARRRDFAVGNPPETYSPFLDRLARFIIGVMGGCSLIAPMLIMALNPSLTKSLITVSVAVVFFALAICLVFETDNKETITATATYAAVLVVFVGTSGSGS